MYSRIVLVLLCLSLLLAACSTEKPPATPAVHVANPASENCTQKGGTLKIESSGKGEYGLCVFGETLACEEWAMMNGDCPVGGVDYTGIDSPEAIYCLVTGNQYTTMEFDTAPPSVKELCVFKDGKNCELLDYYAGRCGPEPTSVP